MLIFDGHGSHITKEFVDYCWENKIRPFQLPPHSTHLTQPLDVGVFQSYKHNFKKYLREQVYLGVNDFSKDDFFAIFNAFSSKTFNSTICQSAFRKTGLIPFDPSQVLSKLKIYGGVEGTDNIQGAAQEDEEDAFGPLLERTPPPPEDWAEFDTPVTVSQHRKGREYVNLRLQNGPLTPTAIRVIEKVTKGSEKLILQGELAAALLRQQNGAAAKRAKRREDGGRIIQKYGEIYVNKGRSQIEADKRDEEKVVNMRENRLNKRWRKNYENVVKTIKKGKILKLRPVN